MDFICMDRIYVIPSIAHGSDQGSDYHFGDILDDADFGSTHNSLVKSSLSLSQEYFKIAPAYGMRFQAPVVRSLVKAYCKILHCKRKPPTYCRYIQNDSNMPAICRQVANSTSEVG